MNNYNTPDNTMMLWIIGLIIFVIAYLIFFQIYMSFNRERKYIKVEMNRSTGREYNHWKKELKRLYRRKLPLIGRFFK